MKPPGLRALAWLFATLVAGTACAVTEAMSSSTLRLTSPSFVHESPIPRRHTCDGADVSPALEWSGVPTGSKSLALVLDDPDAPDPRAPRMTWVHWVVYDVPAALASLPEHANISQLGARDGVNDWGATGYRGPCPPVGRHRYFFKLYALDASLRDLDRPDKATLERAMHGHVLGQATLVGTYER
jgi:Raf kinase inhibitor-like YbhB/YbcL family protein